MPKFIIFLFLSITIFFTSCNDGGSAEAEKDLDSTETLPPLVDTVSNIKPDTTAITPETGDPSGKKFKRLTIKAESDTGKGLKK